MKIFIPVLLIASIALAEPPVGDGYPAARSSHNDHHHDHDGSDHQRSLSQEYGPPSEGYESARNSEEDGYNYNTPNARNSHNSRSQSRFPPATVRVSFNQRFSSAASRKSDNAAARSYNQEHSTPNNARSGISQEYGTPTSRSLSQEYGTPTIVSARTLSTQYGMPDARSNPSQEYGVPVVSSRTQKPSSNFRSAQPPKSSSHDHAILASRSQFQTDKSHSHSTSSARSNDEPEGYEAPKSSFGTRTAPSPTYGTPSSTYGAPATRSSTPHASARNSDSIEVDSISQTYGTPEQKPEETYGAPNARGLSQEYGVPSSAVNLMTTAVSSSFADISSRTSASSTYQEASRSSVPSDHYGTPEQSDSTEHELPSSRTSPSSTYLPASRNSEPSEQYGAPSQRDNAGEGYDYARARALEELQNQEPASYDFGYQIEDQESGSDFGHSETREAGKAQGSYFVVRPDGSKQIVEYEADERGFKPRISIEPPPSARSGGYDDSAQDTSNHQGPY